MFNFLLPLGKKKEIIKCLIPHTKLTVYPGMKGSGMMTVQRDVSRWNDSFFQIIITKVRTYWHSVSCRTLRTIQFGSVSGSVNQNCCFSPNLKVRTYLILLNHRISQFGYVSGSVNQKICISPNLVCHIIQRGHARQGVCRKTMYCPYSGVVHLRRYFFGRLF